MSHGCLAFRPGSGRVRASVLAGRDIRNCGRSDIGPVTRRSGHIGLKPGGRMMGDGVGIRAG